VTVSGIPRGGKVEITGANTLKAQFGAITAAVLNGRAEACLKACYVFERRAKWYSSGNGGGPGRRTGDLNNSIQSMKTGYDEAQVGPTEIGTVAEYAAFVEYGTSNMDAFPYMRPAYETGKEQAAKVLGDELAKLILVGGKVSGSMGHSMDLLPSD